jgi:hypothetical protein
MTGSNDLDRLLGAYLEEGPRRAPERPIDAAVAFARAHPRRRDPFLVLRPDVMGRRSAMFSPQLAWGLLLVALTLGAVAALVVGSRPDSSPVVPPPTVPTTSPSTTPEPSPSPSPSPTTFNVVVDDTEFSGIAWPVNVTDASGSLVEVSNPRTAGETEIDRIDVESDAVGDSRSVVLTWETCADGDPQRVTIDSTGLVWRVERAVCGGDTLGVNPLQVVLTFSGSVVVDDLDVQLVETPREPSSGMAPGVKPPAG